MPHHARLSIKAELMRRCSLLRVGGKIESGKPVSDLIEREITEPLTAVAQKAKQSGIDEVGQKDAVARVHFRSDRIGRMPGVGADGKGIAAVRHERHLFSLG